MPLSKVPEPRQPLFSAALLAPVCTPTKYAAFFSPQQALIENVPGIVCLTQGKQRS